MIPLFDDLPRAHNEWIRYQGREQAARATYLEQVIQAHHQYLEGPWPDREAYSAVERSAWLTYYHAARQAWQAYKTDIERATPPPPDPDSNPYPYPVSRESALSAAYPLDGSTYLGESGGNH